MRNPFARFFGSVKTPAETQPKKPRKPVKPEGRWVQATVATVDVRKNEAVFKRVVGKTKGLPLHADTFERLNLKPLRKGQTLEIRVVSTHLGPEVAEVRSL